MKTNLLLLIWTLFFCLNCICFGLTKIVAVKEEKSDRKNLQLKGTVKRMEVFPAPGAPGLKDVYVFNEAGNIVEQSSVYRGDNRVYTKIINSYDGAGTKIAAEFFRDGKPEGKSKFKSDAKGNIVEQLDYDTRGKLISKTTTKYDAKGNLIETVLQVIEPIDGGMLIFGIAPGDYKTVYTRDENGNPKQIQTFFPDEKIPFGDQRFVYNEKNQKIEESEVSTEYKNKLPRIQRHFYRYNEQDDVIEVRGYESIKESNIEEVRDRFKVIDDKGTVQNGALISDKPFMILWDVTVCNYEYDAHGNWTKKTCKWKMRETKDFVPTTDEPQQRIITYF